VPGGKFVGYKECIQELINKFFARNSFEPQRFVRITGFAGVGKSALARYAINYVQERTLMEGGCIYVNCRSIEEFSDFLKQLNDRIEQDSSGWINIATR